MIDYKFVWDIDKNKLNQRKHDVSFEEARSVFFDEHAQEFYDEKHSDSEHRLLLLGLSFRLRLLIVCHCIREKGNVIRIISARKATKNEQQFYAGEK